MGVNRSRDRNKQPGCITFCRSLNGTKTFALRSYRVTYYIYSLFSQYMTGLPNYNFNVERLDMNRIGFVICRTIILAASLALGACTFGTVMLRTNQTSMLRAYLTQVK